MALVSATAVGDRPWPLLAAAVALPAIWLAGSPVLALLAGMAIGVAADRPLFASADRLGKLALQGAIVLLALRLDPASLLAFGVSWTGAITLYVVATLATGLLLGRWLGVPEPLARLVATGTAICGATAMAAVAPGVHARAAHLAVALAVVFLLNAVAVVVFPPLGQVLGLSAEQFGLWVALAVHDTASVVATASAFSDEAVVTATTAKLIRTLFLVPVLLLFTWGGRAAPGQTPSRPAWVPGFVLAFLALVLVNGALDLPALVLDAGSALHSLLLLLALFLIGAGFRQQTLRDLRGRGALQALLLWLLVVPLTLLGVLAAT